MNTKKNALNPLVWAAMITASMLIAGCDNNDAARFEQATEQVRKLNKAADFYFLEKKKCPASANDLARLFTGKDENDFDFSKDPWGNDYRYAIPGVRTGDPETPDLWSLGPDGKNGTADDVVEQGE